MSQGVEPCAAAHCRLPQQDTVQWIQCDDCDAWYHLDCLPHNHNRDSLLLDPSADFHCGCHRARHRWRPAFNEPNALKHCWYYNQIHRTGRYDASWHLRCKSLRWWQVDVFCSGAKCIERWFGWNEGAGFAQQLQEHPNTLHPITALDAFWLLLIYIYEFNIPKNEIF